jgi:hypothetical protein
MIIILLYLYPTATLAAVVAAFAGYHYARAARAAEAEIPELRRIAGERGPVTDDPTVLAENRVVIDAFALRDDTKPPEGWERGVMDEIDKRR